MGNIAFLKSLSLHFSYDCHIYTDSKFNLRRSYGPVKLSTFRDFEELKLMLRRYNPDLIMGNSFHSSYAVKLARQLNIPSIVYMHDYSCCPPSRQEEKAWKLVSPGIYSADTEVDLILNHADLVLVNSYHLQDRFKRQCGITPSVIYNEFDQDEFLVKDPLLSNDGYITSVDSVWPHKGLDIIMTLARIFKKERFLITIRDDFKNHYYLKCLESLKGQSNITLVSFGPIKNYLRLSKVVLVPSQWPEPFGRIAVEAMACGIPVLASRCGGLQEIIGNSTLGIKDFRNSSAWQNKLNELLTSPRVRAFNVKEGRGLSEKYLKGRSIHKLNSLIEGVIKNYKKMYGPQKTIALCGGTTQRSAYAHINAAWSGITKTEGRRSIVNLKYPMDFSALLIDFFIHHDYSQDLKKVLLPPEGKFIAVRTWDFGRFPTAWIKKINEECDQLWVHTRWVKEQAVKSGIPQERVKVVAHGIDEKIFKPDGKTYALPTSKKFKFIFVGATVERKGVDILLKAYKKAFSHKDDVSLVIKDNKSDDLYEGLTLKKKILKSAKNKSNPEIIYIDDYFSSQDLAGLYRACQAGVFPYRAEGFALPILESMACGTPCIVPHFGACLDYCNGSNAFLMPVKRICVPVGRSFLVNRLGFKEEIEEIDICEVLVDTLAEHMKMVYLLSEQELQKKALAAAKTAHGRFKWSDTLVQIKKCLQEADKYKVPVRLLRERQHNAQFKGNLELIEEARKMDFFNQSRLKNGSFNYYYDILDRHK